MDRRTFIGSAARAAVGGALASASGKLFAQPRATADVAFVGGLVITMNPRRPTAEALAVRSGRILAVGGRSEIDALCGQATRVVDLKGKCVSPGLIDAHSHLISFGQMELHFTNIRPPRVHDFRSLCEVLAEASRALPPGAWLVARGFNEFDEGHFPRRWDIDDATEGHPALLIHWSGQFGIANTAGLRAAGLLDPRVQDPPGGMYLRDKRRGEPDGCLLHYPAIYSVHQPSMTDAQQAEAAEWGVQRFAREGVTCVHDNFCNPLHAVSYVRMEQRGSLPLRMRVYPYVGNLEQCVQAITRVRRYEGRLARLQGMKLAVDGYPLMYDVLPQHSHINLPMHSQEEFQAMIGAIHRAGLQADVHAVGDMGVDLTLEAFSRAAGGDASVRERRHRIEHFMFRRERSIARAGDMGVPVCTQPLHLVVRGDDFLRTFGRDPTAYMVPMASFRRAGVQVSLGADVPASPSHRPLDSIRCAMQRRTAAGVQLDPSERVSFLEALEAHTIAAAHAAFDEDDLGSLEPGKFADLAVWNADLRQVTEDTLDDLEVVATYLAGVPTYEA